MPSVYMETYQLIGIIYRYEFHALDLPVQKAYVSESEEEAQAFLVIFFLKIGVSLPKY